jgi:hypothetical protein
MLAQKWGVTTLWEGHWANPSSNGRKAAKRFRSMSSRGRNFNERLIDLGKSGQGYVGFFRHLPNIASQREADPQPRGTGSGRFAGRLNLPCYVVFSRPSDLPNCDEDGRIFWTVGSQDSQRRIPHLNVQPLSGEDLHTEPGELSAELLLGVTAAGLLQRFESDDDPSLVTLDSSRGCGVWRRTDRRGRSPWRSTRPASR